MNAVSNTPATRDRVVVAMSGGVDSSVAAYLLKRDGYDVVGVTMRLWADEDQTTPPSTDPGQATHQGCCSIDDIEDARRVCRTIGVPHYVVDVQREFRDHVMDYFVDEYRRGRTPHPCIACNDRIKFDFLMRRAAMLDAAYVATGHYARIGRDAATGERTLLKGVDAAKDQSYVLFGMSTDLLDRVLLPVGEYTKPAIRELAVEAGLHLADKADSQEICFVPRGDYRDFLKKRIEPRPGELVHDDGRVLGTHKGIEFFTVGQRRGLGVAPTEPGAEPLFVTRVESETGRVYLGPESALFQEGVRVGNVSYVGGNPPPSAVQVTAKIRYNGLDTRALLEPGPGNEALLRFDTPQRAVTPGQAAVFYDGDRVLGGGYIDGPLR
jgi:tRNA-specific 2-thiouridylase